MKNSKKILELLEDNLKVLSRNDIAITQRLNRIESKPVIEKHEVLKQFEQWKIDNPDEDYQYDEIFEFVHDMSRGDMLAFFEYVVKLQKKFADTE